jgi:hypothetical protein
MVSKFQKVKPRQVRSSKRNLTSPLDPDLGFFFHQQMRVYQSITKEAISWAEIVEP